MRQQAILLGGDSDDSGTNFSDEVWGWNGSAWEQIVESGPSGRRFHNAAFDSARNRTVLFGGDDYYTVPGDLWEFGPAPANTWAAVPFSAPSPDANGMGIMAYAPNQQLTLYFSGGNARFGNASVWGWNGSTWSLPEAVPGRRLYPTGAYDSTNHSGLIFGGSFVDWTTLRVFLSDTWTWSNGHWTLQNVTGPSARDGAAIVYDAARDETVLFGGVTSQPNYATLTFSDETWIWKNGAWTQRSPDTIPPARGYAAATFDGARGKVVLYGGADSSGGRGDMWAWDGSNWAQITKGAESDPWPPAALQQSAMVYDPQRGVTVLFGGDIVAPGVWGSVPSDGTWEWDGSAWSNKSFESKPSARVGHSLIYNPDRGAVVLFGYNAESAADLWEYDGTGWVERTVPGPRPVGGAPMFYDTQRHSAILFASDYGEAWELTPPRDSDGDGHPDTSDACPLDPAKWISTGVCGCGTADDDSDGDGTPNCNDSCSSDPNKTAAGICGCGAADADDDGDGTLNCNDDCPADIQKTSSGICGCGSADTDSDSDGTPNCNDACPNNNAKTAAGVCGCDTSDSDSDGDATPDCNDACPADAAKIAGGYCGCGVSDADNDQSGIADCLLLQELTLRVNQIIALLPKVKPVSKPKAVKTQKTYAAQIKSWLGQMQALGAGLNASVDAGRAAQLQSLIGSCSAKVKKALKTALPAFKENKKKAVQSLNKLKAQL